MGNRKQPFGYKIELGEIVPHPQEADAVRQIYTHYLAGASFMALAEELQEQGIPYDGDKHWNKNMMARILENHRYVGTDRFPALITQEQFNAVQKRRKEMRPEIQQTDGEKELRKLCGSVPSKSVQYKILQMLNTMVKDPQLIQHKTEPDPMVQTLKQQRRELDALLNTPPVDEAEARKMALAYADAVLDSIGPEKFETERLRKLFSSIQSLTELDADLLRLSIRKIVYAGKKVKILIKNNQWIEGECT